MTPLVSNSQAGWDCPWNPASHNPLESSARGGPAVISYSGTTSPTPKAVNTQGIPFQQGAAWLLEEF